MKAKKIYQIRKDYKNVLVKTAEDGRQFFVTGSCLSLPDADKGRKADR